MEAIINGVEVTLVDSGKVSKGGSRIYKAENAGPFPFIQVYYQQAEAPAAPVVSPVAPQVRKPSKAPAAAPVEASGDSRLHKLEREFDAMKSELSAATAGINQLLAALK